MLIGREPRASERMPQAGSAVAVGPAGGERLTEKRLFKGKNSLLDLLLSTIQFNRLWVEEELCPTSALKR